MKPLLLIFASIVLFVAATTFASPESGAEGAKGLPRVFDFRQFKLLFHKQYGSLLDELARQRIYLAAALRAFVSALSYAHFKSTSHLSINGHSDETPEERQKRLVPLELLVDEDVDVEVEEDVKKKVQVEPPSAALAPVASLEEVGVALEGANLSGLEAEIISNRLLTPPEVAAEEVKPAVPKRVASNNPLYEQVELSSSSSGGGGGGGDGGGGDDYKVAPPPLQMGPLKLLLHLPGAKFVQSVLEGAAGARTIMAANSKPDEVFVDLTRDKCFGAKVRDQGQCNSCYAFALISLFEYLHCRETGRLAEFSEQFVVDCGQRVGLEGCQGGKSGLALKFVHQFGLHLRLDYPYLGHEQRCPYQPDTPPAHMAYLQVMGGQIVRLDGAGEFEAELASGRPLMFCLKISADFLDYGGGVDDGRGCSGAETKGGLLLGGHLMLVVGHGRERGEEYYLFRNSYGPQWGLEGHYKLSKRAIKGCACNAGRLSAFTTRSTAYFDQKQQQHQHHHHQDSTTESSREQQYRQFLLANKLD